MSTTFPSPNTTSSLFLVTYSILTFVDFLCAGERDAEFCMLKVARKWHYLFSAVLLSKCFNISNRILLIQSFLRAVTPFLKDYSLLCYCSLCLLLSDEYMSRNIKHIKVEITVNLLLLLVVINLKQLIGKIQIQYPRKKTILLSALISKLKWTESVLPDAKGGVQQHSFRTGRSCFPCGLDYESWRKKLTVKKSSITLLSRRVSRQDSVGFSITFCEDSNIAI